MRNYDVLVSADYGMNLEMIHFPLSGRQQCIADLAPTVTALQNPREITGTIGTEEGCAEGDCGACSIVLCRPANGSVNQVKAFIHWPPSDCQKLLQ